MQQICRPFPARKWNFLITAFRKLRLISTGFSHLARLTARPQSPICEASSAVRRGLQCVTQNREGMPRWLVAGNQRRFTSRDADGPRLRFGRRRMPSRSRQRIFTKRGARSSHARAQGASKASICYRRRFAGLAKLDSFDAEPSSHTIRKKGN